MVTTVTGLDGLTDWLKESVIEVQNITVDNIFEDADATCPVGETGYLKSTGYAQHATKNEPMGAVGYTAEHSIYVHNGTDKMQPRPWLDDAATREMNKS